jgi:hypothetical protein
MVRFVEELEITLKKLSLVKVGTICIFKTFFCFWWHWGLAGTLSLEPHLQFIFVLVVLEMGFHEIFSQAGLEL